MNDKCAGEYLDSSSTSASAALGSIDDTRMMQLSNNSEAEDKLIQEVGNPMEMEFQQSSDGCAGDDEYVEDPLSPVSLVLGNSLIMEVVGKFLPIRSLISLRSICKTWYDALTPVMRKLHKPIRFSALEDLTKYLAIISASQVLPFSKYHLYCLPLQADPVQEFFTSFGPTIKSLNVTIEYDVEPEVGLYLVRSLITSHCPNLVEFEFFKFGTPLSDDFVGTRAERIEWRRRLADQEINFVWNEQPDFNNNPHCLPKLNKLHYSGGWAQSTAFLTDLIHNLAPQLAHFDISGIRGGGGSSRATIEALNILSNKTTNLDQLAVLELPGLTEQALQLLISMNARSNQAHRLGLVELYVFGNIGSDLLSLETFLALQSKTLRSLNFQVESDIQPSQLYSQLPDLQQLEKLTLDINYQEISEGQNPWSLFQLINKKFPKLNHLNFCSYHFGGSNGITKTYSPHANLRVLNLTDTIVDLEQLCHLGRTFPNLDNVGIVLGHTYLLGSLWSCWPHLRWLELKVMWSIEDDSREPEQLDEWITGIPMVSCKLLKLFLEQDVPRRGLQWIKPAPGISDLKNLCSLKLRLPMNITDISIYYGLVPLNTKFTALEINMTRLISPAAAAVMAEMLD